MNSITLNGVTRRNGEWINSQLELAKKADGTWHATKFGDIMLDTYNASKSGASQSRNCDTYEAEPANRTELSDRELAELARKYNPSNMTQDQYDALLRDLMEKGVLSTYDACQLGYKGLQPVDMGDIDIEALLATGGIIAGPSYATSLDNNGGKLIFSLEDTDGDLIRWLEAMLARQEQEIIAGSRQRSEALNALYNVVKRM